MDEVTAFRKRLQESKNEVNSWPEWMRAATQFEHALEIAPNPDALSEPKPKPKRKSR